MHRPTDLDSRPELMAAALRRRPNYFAGKLFTADDMRREQEYHRDRVRFTARAVHGTGVVSGLRVSTGGGVVTVSPGISIDCRGELLVLASAVSLPHPTDSRTIFVAIGSLERGVTPVHEPHASDSDGTVFAETEEIAWVHLATDECARRHRHEGKRMVACGESHSVPLARLRPSGRGWSVDRAWKPHRIRS